MDDGELDKLDAILHNASPRLDTMDPVVSAVDQKRYVQFILYTFFINFLLFVKFKNQL